MVLFDQIDKSVRKGRGVRNKLKAYIMTKVSTIKNLMNLYNISRERFISLSDEVRHEKELLYERERLLIEEILKSGVLKGEIEVANPYLLSSVIISALKDIELRWIVEESLGDIEKHLDVLLDILFYGMAPRNRKDPDERK